MSASPNGGFRPALTSFDAAIQKIIELDNNDEKYLEILNQPIFVDPTYPARLEQEYEAFLVHIFEQPLEKAYRRSRVYFAGYYNSFLQKCYKIWYSPFLQLAIKAKKKLFR